MRGDSMSSASWYAPPDRGCLTYRAQEKKEKKKEKRERYIYTEMQRSSNQCNAIGVSSRTDTEKTLCLF